LENRDFDIAASHRVRGFVVGSHLIPSSVQMKLALSQEEQSQRSSQKECEAEAVAGASAAPHRCEPVSVGQGSDRGIVVR
jgi:hypothetical protein